MANYSKGLRCEAFQNTAGARIDAERTTAMQNGLLESWPKNYRKIVFSDEAHFWLNSYVNKQNCRIWSEDQPEELRKLPMHPKHSKQIHLNSNVSLKTVNYN